MSTRIKCDICGKSFNPSGFAQHVCIKQPVTTMLTRKMQELMAKKKRKVIVGIPNDIARDGVFPQNESVEQRMEAIKHMIRELNELKLARIPNIVAAVRSSLQTWRARRKLYNKFGVAMN